MNTGITKGQMQFIKELHQKEGRNDHGLFLVEGEKMMIELLASNHMIHSIYHTIDYQFPNKPSKIETFHVSQRELERISTLKTPNKVLAIVKIPSVEVVTSEKLIYCCNIQDPGNAGTIVRIADWFGISNIFFSAGSVDVYSPKVVQATMGSIFRVNCHLNCGVNSIIELKKMDYKVYAAEMSGKSVNTFEFNKKGVLILGNESHGISEEYNHLVDAFVTIPKIGGADSLNVAVACGIICHKMIFN